MAANKEEVVECRIEKNDESALEKTKEILHHAADSAKEIARNICGGTTDDETPEDGEAKHRKEMEQKGRDILTRKGQQVNSYLSGKD